MNWKNIFWICLAFNVLWAQTKLDSEKCLDSHRKIKLAQPSIQSVVVSNVYESKKRAEVQVTFKKVAKAKYYAVFATSGKKTGDVACLSTSPNGSVSACKSAKHDKSTATTQTVIFPGLKAHTEFSFHVKAYTCNLQFQKSARWGSADLSGKTQAQKKSGFLFKQKTSKTSAESKSSLKFSLLDQVGILSGVISKSKALTRNLEILSGSSGTTKYLDLSKDALTNTSHANVFTSASAIGALDATKVTALLNASATKPYIVILTEETDEYQFEVYFNMETLITTSSKKAFVIMQEDGSAEEKLHIASTSDPTIADYAKSLENLWVANKGNSALWKTPFQVPAGAVPLSDRYAVSVSEKSLAKVLLLSLSNNEGLGLEKYELVHQKLFDFWSTTTATQKANRLSGILQALQAIDPEAEAQSDIRFSTDWPSSAVIPVFGAQRLDLSMVNGDNEIAGANLKAEQKLLVRVGCKIKPVSPRTCLAKLFYKKETAGADANAPKTKVLTAFPSVKLLDASNAEDQTLWSELLADGLWVYSPEAGSEILLDIRLAPSYFVSGANSFPNSYTTTDLSNETDATKIALITLGAVEAQVSSDVLSATYIQEVDEATGSVTITKQVQNFLQNGKKAKVVFQNGDENATYEWKLSSHCTGANCLADFDCTSYITNMTPSANSYSFDVAAIATPDYHSCKVTATESIDGKEVRFGEYEFITGQITTDANKTIVLGCFGLNEAGQPCTQIPLNIADGISTLTERKKSQRPSEVKISITNDAAELFYTKNGKTIALFHKEHDASNGKGEAVFEFDENGVSSLEDLSDFPDLVQDNAPTWEEFVTTLSIRGAKAGKGEIGIELYTENKGAVLSVLGTIGNVFKSLVASTYDAKNTIKYTAVQLELRADFDKDGTFGDAQDTELKTREAGLGLVVTGPTTADDGTVTPPEERIKIELGRFPTDLASGFVKLSLTKQTASTAGIDIYDSEGGDTPLVFTDGVLWIPLGVGSTLKDILPELWIEGTSRSSVRKDLELKIEYFLKQDDPLAKNSDRLNLTVVTCEELSKPETTPLAFGEAKFFFESVKSSGMTIDGLCSYKDIDAGIIIQVDINGFFNKEFKIPFTPTPAAGEEPEPKASSLAFNYDPFTSEFEGVTYTYEPTPENAKKLFEIQNIGFFANKASVSVKSNAQVNATFDLGIVGPAEEKELISLGTKSKIKLIPILKDADDNLKGAEGELNVKVNLGPDGNFVGAGFSLKGLALEYEYDGLAMAQFVQSDVPANTADGKISGAFVLVAGEANKPTLRLGGVEAKLEKFALAFETNLFNPVAEFKLLANTSVGSNTIDTKAEIHLTGIKGLQDDAGNDGTLVLDAAFVAKAGSVEEHYTLGLSTTENTIIKLYGLEISNVDLSSTLSKDFALQSFVGKLDAEYTGFEAKSGNVAKLEEIAFIIEGPTAAELTQDPTRSSKLTKFTLANAEVVYKSVGLKLETLEYDVANDYLSFAKAEAEINSAVTLGVSHVRFQKISNNYDISIGGAHARLEKEPLFVDLNATFPTEGGVKGTIAGAFKVGKKGIAFSGNFAGGHAKKYNCGSGWVNIPVADSANYFNWGYGDLAIAVDGGIPLGPTGLFINSFKGRLGINYHIPVDKIFTDPLAGNQCKDSYIIGLGLGIGDALGLFSIRGEAAVQMSATQTSISLKGDINIPKFDPTDATKELSETDQILHAGIEANYIFGDSKVGGAFAAEFYLPNAGNPLISVVAKNISYGVDWSGDAGKHPWFIKGENSFPEGSTETAEHFLEGQFLNDPNLKFYGSVLDFHGNFGTFIPSGDLEGTVDMSKSITFRYPSNFMYDKDTGNDHPLPDLNSATEEEKTQACNIAKDTDTWGFGFIGDASFGFQSTLKAKLKKEGFSSTLTVVDGKVVKKDGVEVLEGSGVTGSVFYKFPCLFCNVDNCLEQDRVNILFGGEVSINNKCFTANGNFRYVDEDYDPDANDDDMDNGKLDLNVKFGQDCI